MTSLVKTKKNTARSVSSDKKCVLDTAFFIKEVFYMNIEAKICQKWREIKRN